MRNSAIGVARPGTERRAKIKAALGPASPRTLETVLALLVRERVEVAEQVEAYADALLASGASPLAVCAVRDAADIVRGVLRSQRH